MANPYYHSLSSVKTFGGRYTDYMLIHDWLDASKSITTHFSHRALRHHDYGIQVLQRVMSRHTGRKDGLMLNSDGARVAIEHVARQHVIEDCGFVPTIDQWFDAAAIIEMFGEAVQTDHEITEKVAKEFSGKPSDYMEFSTVQNVVSWVHRFTFWYHSFGIFTFADVLGPVFQTGTCAFPTRVIAEAWTRHATKSKKNVWGSIPDARSVLHYILLQGNCSWMHGHAKQLSKDRSLRRFADSQIAAGA